MTASGEMSTPVQKRFSRATSGPSTGIFRLRNQWATRWRTTAWKPFSNSTPSTTVRPSRLPLTSASRAASCRMLSSTARLYYPRRLLPWTSPRPGSFVSAFSSHHLEGEEIADGEDGPHVPFEIGGHVAGIPIPGLEPTVEEGRIAAAPEESQKIAGRG